MTGFRGGKALPDTLTRKLAGRYQAETIPRELVMRAGDMPGALRKPTRVVWNGASDGKGKR